MKILGWLGADNKKGRMVRFRCLKTIITIGLATSAIASCGGLARSGSGDAVSDPKGGYQAGKTTSSAALPPSSGDSLANIPKEPAKTTEDPQLEAERAKIMGMWIKGCVAGGAGESSSRTGIEFTKTEFNVHVFTYQDNNCQIIGSQKRIEGNYVLSLAHSGVNPIDLTYDEKVYYRFYTNKSVNEANANKVCARTAWVAGVEYGCAENAKKTLYNIVKVGDESLALGLLDAAQDATSAAKRPSAADEAGAYAKKK